MAIAKVILNGEVQMDVTSDTVEADKLLEGETATKNDGTKVTGTFVVPDPEIEELYVMPSDRGTIYDGKITLGVFTLEADPTSSGDSNTISAPLKWWSYEDQGPIAQPEFVIGETYHVQGQFGVDSGGTIETAQLITVDVDWVASTDETNLPFTIEPYDPTVFDGGLEITDIKLSTTDITINATAPFNAYFRLDDPMRVKSTDGLDGYMPVRVAPAQTKYLNITPTKRIQTFYDRPYLMAIEGSGTVFTSDWMSDVHAYGDGLYPGFSYNMYCDFWDNSQEGSIHGEFTSAVTWESSGVTISVPYYSSGSDEDFPDPLGTAAFTVAYDNFYTWKLDMPSTPGGWNVNFGIGLSGVGYFPVVIGSIPASYITPSGTYTITNNGSYNISRFSYVSVGVNTTPNLLSKAVDPTDFTQVITANEEELIVTDKETMDVTTVYFQIDLEEYRSFFTNAIITFSGTFVVDGVTIMLNDATRACYSYDGQYIESGKPLYTDNQSIIKYILISDGSGQHLYLRFVLNKTGPVTVSDVNIKCKKTVTTNTQVYRLHDETPPITRQYDASNIKIGDTVIVAGTLGSANGGTVAYAADFSRSFAWTGKSYTFYPQGYPTGSRAITINPYTSQITVGSAYTTGIFGIGKLEYDGLSQVTVNAIPSSYIIPSGTYSISSKGVYDIASYASVDVIADSLEPYILRSAITSYSSSTIPYIGSGAFAFNSKLKTVSIPNASIIYDAAFMNCSINIVQSAARSSINFSNVTSIGPYAFASGFLTAGGIIDGELFPNCTTIGSYAFFDTYISQAIFPNCVNIGNGAFANTQLNVSNALSFPKCTGISYFAFTNTQLQAIYSDYFPVCNYVGSYAFVSYYVNGRMNMYSCLARFSFINYSSLSDNSYLQTVEMPNVAYISDSAFARCIALESVSFPKCRHISAYAFAGCSSLRDVYFPNVISISGSAFVSAFTSSATIEFPACTSISLYAFCSARMQAISIPEVNSILDGTFYGCSNLQTVYAPMVSRINSNAFTSCYSLTSVSLSSIISVSTVAFYSCTSLRSIETTTILHVGHNAFVGCHNLELPLTCLSDCSYIGNGAFVGCSNMSGNLVLNSISFIGSRAFANCIGLSEVSITFDPTVSIINSGGGQSSMTWAFVSCSNLSQVTLIDNYSSSNQYNRGVCVASSMFGSCSNLEAVYASMPYSSYLIIGSSAFAGCSKLSTLPDNLPLRFRNGESGAFAGCSALTSATVWGYVHPWAFYRCSRLESIYVVSPNAYGINANAFTGTAIDNLYSFIGHYGSIYVPSSAYDDYITASGWSYYSSRITSWIQE